MKPTPARIATLFFWLLIVSTGFVLAWRYAGNPVHSGIQGVLAALGIAYGICIIAMNARSNKTKDEEDKALNVKERNTSAELNNN